MKRIKKGLAFFLATWIWMLALPVGTLSAMENTAEFLGGDGTEESPYLISNKTHLNNVRNHLDAHFLMVADIEFNEADFAQGGEFYNGGQGWEPIGADRYFTGVFDGDGHIVDGLACYRSGTGGICAGLFGFNKGEIKNLGLIDCDVSAKSKSYPTTPDAYAGGIVGYNTSYGTISNCYNTGNVSATIFHSSDRIDFPRTHAGGIAGENYGKISNCYNIGSVNATLSTSFHSHSDQFEAHAGGIVGYNTSYGTIGNCYNIGSVDATVFYSPDRFTSSAYAGGIAGGNGYGTLGEDCYYLNVASKVGVGTGEDNTVSCTMEQMRSQATFSGFDFDAIWTMSGNETYPYPELQKMFHADVQEENVTEFNGGTGAQYAPYLIANKEHLNNVRNHLGAYFKMVADIHFTTDDFAENGFFYNDGQGWEPIGTSENPFFGVFDGANHTIHGLEISISDKNPVFVGLFGCNTGIIRNVGMVDGTVSAAVSSAYAYMNSYVGGIAGYNREGTISNCHNTGSIGVSVSFSSSNTSSSAHAHVGGIAGYSLAGTIDNCYNTGRVSTTVSSTSPDVISACAPYIGGITGYNQGSTISECYNTGNVSSSVFSEYLGRYTSAETGGIAGISRGTIRNCYNIGSVFSNTGDVGGIAGENQSGGTICDCYNTGSTTGPGFYIAGIAGRNGDGKAVRNCYYLNIISQGVTGDDFTTSCSMEQIKQESTFIDFNFDLVWTMIGNKDYLCPELMSVPMIFEKSLVSISLRQNPTKVEYIEETAFDPAGGWLTLTYNNGTGEEIALTLDMVSGFDNTRIGKQILTITYQGKTTAFEVTIIAKSLTKIEVSPPTKTEYLEGKDELNVTGGKVTVYYNNGSSEIIDLTLDMVTGFDNTRVGTQKLTVTYKWGKATFEVEITKKSVERIEVTHPIKNEYLEGDEFDASGMVVTAHYNNDTSEVVTDYGIGGYDSAPGAKIITVTYGGKTATFEVTVRAKTLTEIRVTKQPAKRTYLEGDAFDSAGMEITAYYDNGTSEVVTDYGISGYDSTPGVKRLTVTYGGKTAALEVTVRGKALVSIAVTKNPDQMTYVEGTALDTTGMELTLVFDNGTKEVLATGWTETYDFSQPGRQEVRIDCRGKTTTLTVMVLSKALTGIAVSRLPNKLTYIEGNAFSAAGMEVTAYYDNNTSEIVTDRVTIQGYDSAPGIKTMAISYQGKETSFTVTVEAKKPVSIAWKAKPNKTVYFVGEELSLSGAVILIRYNNGTTAEQKLEGSWGADQYNPNQIGTQTISIRYQETPPISFTVTVKSRVPSSITSGTYSVGGGFLSKVGAGTTAAQLLGGINEKDYYKVYKGNTEVTGNALVGTGMAVKLLDGGTVKQTAAVVVTGDTNGDGQITITDMLAVKAHVLKKSALAGAAAKAADTSGDKAISITDFIQIKAHILGKDKIQPRAC